ncbi:hypothetical protein D3C71_1409490 [compost metagenome]
MLPDGGFVCGIRAFFCARKQGFYAIDRGYGCIVFRNRQFRNREILNIPCAGIRRQRIFAFRGGRALPQYLLHFAQIQPRQRGGRVRGLQRRQFIQGTQAQIIQKLARGSEQRGTTRGIAVTDHFDPAAVLERLHDLGRDRHAANVLDIAPRHRLAPGHDGQRFHHGARVLGRLLGAQALQVALHARATLKTPARRQLHELQATVGPVALQRLEQRPHRAVIELFIVSEQLAHIGKLHRLHRA